MGGSRARPARHRACCAERPPFCSFSERRPRLPYPIFTVTLRTRTCTVGAAPPVLTIVLPIAACSIFCTGCPPPHHHHHTHTSASFHALLTPAQAQALSLLAPSVCSSHAAPPRFDLKAPPPLLGLWTHLFFAAALAWPLRLLLIYARKHSTELVGGSLGQLAGASADGLQAGCWRLRRRHNVGDAPVLHP